MEKREKRKIVNCPVSMMVKISKHASMPLPSILEADSHSKDSDVVSNANETMEEKPRQIFDQKRNEKKI